MINRLLNVNINGLYIVYVVIYVVNTCQEPKHTSFFINAPIHPKARLAIGLAATFGS